MLTPGPDQARTPQRRAVSTRGYARLPFSWLEDDAFVETLSGDAIRLYVLLTAECARDLTDGWVSPRVLRIYLLGSEHEELVATGYLAKTSKQERGRTVDGYVLTEFLAEQKSRADREAEKAAVAERVARSRAKKSGRATPSVAEHVTDDVTRYTSVTAARSRSTSGSGSRSGRELLRTSSGEDRTNDAHQGAARRQDAGGDDGAGQHENNRHAHAPGDNKHSDSGSEGRFRSMATPHHDPEPPPVGKPSEQGGSGNYLAPLRASQAHTLLAARISPERFVRSLRRKAEVQAWQHLDWEALVSRQRFTKALAVRAGEPEALLPQIEDWLWEGAE